MFDLPWRRNYARELMQLFSIGLWELNPDGTQELDAAGEAIQTYGSEEIQSFAKAWTGFRLASERGNIEGERNRIDPMNIMAERRDAFPKMDLYHGHLGDGYPRCLHLPPREFLRRGATYRYISSGMRSQLQTDHGNFNSQISGNYPKLMLRRSSSALYRALCWPHANTTSAITVNLSAPCTYASEVHLDGVELACDGMECQVEKPRTVGVADADGSLFFYEYVPRACVHFPFFEGGQSAQRHRYDRSTASFVCLDPNASQAGVACCNPPEKNAYAQCGFLGERVAFATARRRCESNPVSQRRHMCSYPRRKVKPDSNPLNSSQAYNADCQLVDEYTWMDIRCSIEAQIDLEGKVSLVHATTDTQQNGPSERTPSWLQLNSRSSFRVRWAGGAFPTAVSNCSSAVGCRIDGETCICSTEVSTAAVFVDSNAPPNKASILTQLHIGSVAPADWEAGAYEPCITAACQRVANESVDIFTRAGSAGAFDEHTIFRVRVNSSRVLHLANVESTVHVVGARQYGFRNPPSFMMLHDPARRDAAYETDALIDHLLYHKNTPPFIATRLLQRLTTSNPSPRYVKAVAHAFEVGSFEGIGSGVYGDLGAMVAAILLDREGASPILDADPSHGGLREPLIKLYHLMRAMEFTTESGREIELPSLNSNFGECPFESPTVFSFFLPEYIPAGSANEAGLLSPEAQLATAPKLIGFLNGVQSLIKYGLSSCDGGLGGSRSCAVRGNSANRPQTDGYLMWRPSAPTSEATIDGLNLLLTGGRLEAKSRALIMTAYADTINATGASDRALQVAQEMVMATAEFGATNDNAQRPMPRAPLPEVPVQNRRYKALIFLYLKGGADTFNMLMPHSHCRNASGSHDLYGEYVSTRTVLAIARNSLLPLDASTSNQTCRILGLHPALPFLKRAYDGGEAAFFANVGALVEPVTSAQVAAKSARLPLSLFAHNVQTMAAQTIHAQNKNAPAGILGAHPPH